MESTDEKQLKSDWAEVVKHKDDYNDCKDELFDMLSEFETEGVVSLAE